MNERKVRTSWPLGRWRARVALAAGNARQQSKGNGFTIVEILVVIAILLVVSAILLPVFFKAKTAAKHVSCMSNLKQLGAALVLYAGDHDDYLPPQCNDEYYIKQWDIGGWASVPTGSTMPQLFADALFRYTRNADILFCPEDVDARSTRFNFQVRHDITSYYYCPKNLDMLLLPRLPLNVSLSSSRVHMNMLMRDDIAANAFPADLASGKRITNHDDNSWTLLFMDTSAKRRTAEQLFSP